MDASFRPADSTPRVLRALIVEDQAADADHIVQQLERCGYAVTWQRVDSAATMQAALADRLWDIVFSGYNMPRFTGLQALMTLQDSGREIPFIVVSAAIGEEIVEMMRAGAHDYVFRDRLAQLGPATERALRATEDRLARRRAEQALRESEARVRRELHAILDPEGDLGGLELADVIDCDAVQALMNLFYELTHIGMAVLDLKGRILVATGWQDICTQFHRAHPESCQHCLESDIALSGHVAPGAYKLYRCRNNMWDMVTPIMLGRRHVGNLFLGQFFFEDERPDEALFRQQARRYGFDEAAYLAALDRVPRWSRKTVDTAMTFYARFGQMISALGHSNIQLARALAEKNALLDQLRASEERYRLLVDSQGEGIGIMDADEVFTFANPASHVIFGVEQGMLPGRSLRDFVSESAFAAVIAQTAHRRQGETGVYELRIRRPDGQERAIIVTATPYRDHEGQFVGSFGVFRDITDWKNAEEALRESEARYRSLVDYSEDLIFAVDRDGIFRAAGGMRLADFGLRPEELVGASLEALTGDEAPLYRQRHDRVFETGRSLTYEHTFTFRGVTKTDLTTIYPIRGQGGEVALVGVICRDITERKRAEEDRERLMSAIEQGGEMVVITDAQGIILYVNPAFERITGYSRQEAVGQNPRFLKSDAHDEAFYRALWGAITQGVTWRGRLVNRRKDGTTYTELSSISPVRDATGAIANYVAVKRDITRELQLEDQLRQAQRMEAIGRLAGGVAHDFNNMLQSILGYGELALEQTPPDAPLYQDLSEILRAARHSAQLTRQLLAFARQQPIAPVILDLNDAVAGMLKMLRRLIGEEIGLTWNPGSALWKVRIDPSQVDQILINLAVNARDAITDVGAITVETANISWTQEDRALYPDTIVGDYVQLTVRDSGCGMDQHTLAHLFEPFFTTKEVGQGTGLGLSTVFGIVKQNGGHIIVTSELGRGSVFSIYLPRFEGDDAALADAEVLGVLPRGDETLLLVEDEPAILALGKRLLERLGYTVLAADTPSEALRLARERVGPIHLLATDVIMPQMDGVSLAEQLLTVYPDIKRLFMSGHSAEIASRNQTLGENVTFLFKPFTARILATKVREALAR